MASNINAYVLNTIGTGNTPNATATGGAASTPNLIDSTSPNQLPSYLSSSGVPGGLGPVSPDAGNTSSLFSDPVPLLIGGAALVAAYYLLK